MYALRPGMGFVLRIYINFQKIPANVQNIYTLCGTVIKYVWASRQNLCSGFKIQARFSIPREVKNNRNTNTTPR